ncbi:hypothetical protein P7C70_g1718, partial [Phenoliferia sp. Uapishka_3]
MTALRRQYFETHGFDVTPSPPTTLPRTRQTFRAAEADPQSSTSRLPNITPSAPTAHRTAQRHPSTLQPTPTTLPQAVSSSLPANPSLGELRERWKAEKLAEETREWATAGARRSRKSSGQPPPTEHTRRRRAPSSPTVDSKPHISHDTSFRNPHSPKIDWQLTDQLEKVRSPQPHDSFPSARYATPQQSAALNTFTYSPLRSTIIDPPVLPYASPNTPQNAAQDQDINLDLERRRRQDQEAIHAKERRRRAEKLSNLLEARGLVRSPRRMHTTSPPRPHHPTSPPLPHPTPNTMPATYVDFSIAVTPEGPLYPGSTIIIAVTLGDLEVEVRLDGTLPPLTVVFQGKTVLAPELVPPGGTREHEFFRDEFEDAVSRNLPTIYYQTVLPVGGDCVTCGVRNELSPMLTCQVYPPSFEHPGPSQTSTIWEVRANFGLQSASMRLELRAPPGPLESLYKKTEPSTFYHSTRDIADSAEGYWTGFILEDAQIHYTAHPLPLDSALVLLDVALLFRFDPSFHPSHLSYLLDRLKPGSNFCDIYPSLFDFRSEQVIELSSGSLNDENVPLKVSAEVLGSSSADFNKRRVKIRLRLGLRAPLGRCRPFTSCAGFRVDYSLRLSLGGLVHEDGQQDGLLFDLPIFEDEELEGDGRMGGPVSAKAWKWCGIDRLCARLKAFVFGANI